MDKRITEEIDRKISQEFQKVLRSEIIGLDKSFETHLYSFLISRAHLSPILR